jgi:hypothetical protein
MKVFPLFGAVAILSGIVIAQAPPVAPVTLKNVATSAGVTFVLDNHPTPEKHLIESVPGGVAAFDYNGDGRVDLFFTNGAVSPTLDKSAGKYWNRLYRNDSSSSGGMRFTDVTKEANLAGAGHRPVRCRSRHASPLSQHGWEVRGGVGGRWPERRLWRQ